MVDRAAATLYLQVATWGGRQAHRGGKNITCQTVLVMGR